jgi:hypothetical protein
MQEKGSSFLVVPEGHEIVNVDDKVVLDWLSGYPLVLLVQHLPRGRCLERGL